MRQIMGWLTNDKRPIPTVVQMTAVLALCAVAMAKECFSLNIPFKDTNLLEISMGVSECNDTTNTGKVKQDDS